MRAGLGFESRSCGQRPRRTPGWTRVVALLGVLAGLTACTRVVTLEPAPPQGTAGCRLVAGDPTRTVLPDGARIMGDPTTVAVSGTDVLFLGSNFHQFSDSDTRYDSIAGVIRHADGRLSPVPVPPSVAIVREPRAVADANGGWHVLFITNPRPPLNRISYDTTNVWYAHYDGGAWSGSMPIARVPGATLNRQSASELVSHQGRLAFAFPYDRSAETGPDAPGSKGVVAITGHYGKWNADTLATFEAPISVRLAPFGNHIRAYLAMRYFADRRWRGPAVLASDYRDSWSDPRLVHDPEPENATTLLLTLGGGRPRTISWIAGTLSPGEQLEWGTIGEDGLFDVMTVTTAADLFGTVMVELDDGTTAWLARHGGSDRRLAVHVARDGDARLLAVLDVPLMNFNIPAVSLGADRILVFTGGPDPTPRVFPAFISYLTEISVSCGRDRH
jgi:hypothetical protein